MKCGPVGASGKGRIGGDGGCGGVGKAYPCGAGMAPAEAPAGGVSVPGAKATCGPLPGAEGGDWGAIITEGSAAGVGAGAVGGSGAGAGRASATCGASGCPGAGGRGSVRT